MSLYWNPAPLNAAIAKAYELSLGRAREDAHAHSPSSKADVALVGNTLQPTGLGTVFEEGRKGGYDIQPKLAQALKIGTGFAEFAKGGPMAPEPFIRPAAGRWANGGFQSTARATLAASGY